MHIPSEIQAEEAEEIGVEHLLRDIKDNTVSSLGSQVTEQLGSLKGLCVKLSEIRSYLQKVSKGELPIHHGIFHNLQDMFSLLPRITLKDSLRNFTIETNDQMLVMYLSSLIRAVLALHSLISNKLENRTAERKVEDDEQKEKERLDKAKIEKLASASLKGHTASEAMDEDVEMK